MPGELDQSPSDAVIPLPAPAGLNEDGSKWQLIAHSKNVVKGWISICSRLQENAKRSYAWLRTDPRRSIPRRCYPLRHKHYQGVWCYEIGSGDRIYYKPRDENRDVLVYYAGPHPVKIPYPPID